MGKYVGSEYFRRGSEKKVEDEQADSRAVSASSPETNGKGPLSSLSNGSSPGGKKGASSATDESPVTSELIGAKPLVVAILRGASALAVMPDSKDCISRSRGTWR
jgi:hypothetical protein